MNLKAMSIDRLSKLREQVDAALNAKVIEDRRGVQAQLSMLDHAAARGSRGKGGRGACEEQLPRKPQSGQSSRNMGGTRADYKAAMAEGRQRA